jgi:hypothetical protein
MWETGRDGTAATHDRPFFYYRNIQMPTYEVKLFYLQKRTMEINANSEEDAISMARKRVAGVKSEEPYLYEIHVRRALEKENIPIRE